MFVALVINMSYLDLRFYQFLHIVYFNISDMGVDIKLKLIYMIWHYSLDTHSRERKNRIISNSLPETDSLDNERVMADFFCYKLAFLGLNSDITAFSYLLPEESG